MLRKTALAGSFLVVLAAPAAFAQTQAEPASSVQAQPPAQAQPQAQSQGWSGEVQPVGNMRAAMCIEREARVASWLAYLNVKLQLTAEQRPLWDKWLQAMTANAGAARATCVKHFENPDANGTILDRLAFFQEMAAGRAERLKAQQPILEALYKSLTPEQRAIIDTPMFALMGMHGLWGGRGMQHPAWRGEYMMGQRRG